MWHFKKDSTEVGEKEGWQNGLNGSRTIAVPGSWNEQFADSRDYLGMVWYEKETYVPSGWKGSRIFIRVGSATYAAKLWINGKLVGSHEGSRALFAVALDEIICSLTFEFNTYYLNGLCIHPVNRIIFSSFRLTASSLVTRIINSMY